MDTPSWRVEWSDALSMSNPEIDAEHQNFLSLVNDLNHAIIYRRETYEVQQIMKRILNDAKDHFSNEEKILVEAGYPGAQAHSLIHQELLAKLELISKQLNDEKFYRYWSEVALIIKGMLVNHLFNEDVKYIEYLQNIQGCKP
ncbi:MAG: hemerythrin domain-containing protein [Sedimenticola sp.]